MLAEFDLREINVTLIQGSGAIAGDTTFAVEEKLTQQFTQAITKHLAAVLAREAHSESASVDIKIDYKRRYNIGGSSLNKPEVAHVVEVSKQGNELVCPLVDLDIQRNMPI